VKGVVAFGWVRWEKETDAWWMLVVAVVVMVAAFWLILIS
jgi:hypothetical protein